MGNKPRSFKATHLLFFLKLGLIQYIQDNVQGFENWGIRMVRDPKPISTLKIFDLDQHKGRRVQ